MQPQVLIVDDVSANLNVLRDALEPEGYSILGASHGKAALKIAAGALPDLILLDVLMPGMDGYEVCRQLKQREETQHIPVIFVTMRDDKESILQGFRAGSVDYITKPYEKEEVLLRVKTHIEIQRLTHMLSERNKALQQRAAELASANRQLQQANERLQREMAKRKQAEAAQQRAEEAFQKADEHLSILSQQEASHWGIEGFVGKSKTIERIVEEVRQLQSAGTTSVLITGESGTGKELVARALHFGGTRDKGPFLPVNCSTIPRELAESSFFGHVRGAFTGAKDDRKGYFELADGGTLFLDEIGDMPLELQPKLLRVIEDGCFTPVGGVREKHGDVRILAATNQDIRAKIAEGAFREDLYFRLARFTVSVPPLRERKEDIPLLTEHFLKLFAAEMGIEPPTLSQEASAALGAYPFPGNVRELKNIIEHALIKNSSSVIRPQHLHFIDVRESPAEHTVQPSREAERALEPKQREALMVKRVRKSGEGKARPEQEGAPSSITDEEKILAYVRQQGSISNPECRELLSVPKPRATYLLQKMERYGLLVHKGEHRWSRYYLP